MRFLSVRLCLVGLLAASSSVAVGALEDLAAVEGRFADPPREFASGPLWVWNDDLTETQIRETLRDLAGQRVRQAFVHPRPGLMTPYLGDDWFRLWKVALDEAAKLDMNIWIYDENSYPSGFAGGWVPELMPESRGMGLEQREVKSVAGWKESFVAVYRLEGNSAEDVSAKVKAGAALPEGRYWIAEIVRAGNSPWHGGRSYVNLITKGVTEKFIDVTLEPYRRLIGDQFGKRVPGSFTDEPQLRPAGGLPWCPDLPEQFAQRRGYDLLPVLPGLAREVGDWQRVRHDYFRTLNELFVERWAQPYFDWCEANGLMFTGHYWDHEWPNCVGVPDNMAMAAWQQAPGIDCLMNQYAEHTHAQFGNLRFVKELASVANQMGRARRLCEIYGAGGWDLRFVDMKRIADWLGVLGVNLFDEHLSYITLRGARKRDHPQSFSYHEPWWPDYHVMADYLARLSVAMSAGEEVNHVVVIEPTTTAWMHQGNGARLGDIGARFFNFLRLLEAAQVDYDLLSEDVLARHGSVAVEAGQSARLRVGQRDYSVLIIPPGTENLEGRTVDLVEQALRGLVVWCLEDTPSRIDGLASDRCAGLAAKHSNWRAIDEVRDMAWLAGTMAFDGLKVDRVPGDAGILFHQRRRLADGDLLLLVNTSLDAPSRGEVFTSRKHVESWDLFTGGTTPYPARAGERSLTVAFDLPPAGSLLLKLSDAAGPRTAGGSAPVDGRAGRNARQVAASPLTITRLEPNVLTLDYVDVRVGEESRASLYFYDANRWVWQKHGLERNPWDSAVQFKDELIARAFPGDSGFGLSYRFTIEGAVPPDLAIVIERPDLYQITCNGQPVSARAGDWWLDKAFGRIALAAAAREGANEVHLEARPFTVFHEIEPAYVLGDFALDACEHGFVIRPPAPVELQAAQPVVVHAINPDGRMWLSGGIGYAPDAEGRLIEDREPSVLFDFGKPTDLAGIRIWNYCEGHVRDLTARGAKDLQVWGFPDRPEEAPRMDLGRFELPRANGPARPVTLPIKAQSIRRVAFDIRSNHAGVTYPATGAPPDNGFVGLAEVQFLSAAGQPVNGVSVAGRSGELPGHQRTAAHLLDGSGLTTERAGWREQGLPFYAGTVSYHQAFEVTDASGRFVVRLPEWLGSVARVRVNAATAGRIIAPPWECDVSGFIRPGSNRIDVEVVGTLKNTLGPHHGSPGLGSAWPGMFQRGPNPGPPPGAEYSLVGYGLFEPFVLERRPATE
ncbi:MAG: hypothetical protein H7A47_01705 [Verrucomicrobiales bacterium]|nr:hypothetical protein [Verrucomicrobiales bacterium]